MLRTHLGYFCIDLLLHNSAVSMQYVIGTLFPRAPWWFLPKFDAVALRNEGAGRNRVLDTDKSRPSQEGIYSPRSDQGHTRNNASRRK